MAETMLAVVTEPVLNKALSLVSEEITGVLGVHEHLQTLAKRIQMIQALLCDAGSKESCSKTVELWLKNLQAVATDADNLLDEISYEDLRRKVEKGKRTKFRKFFSSSNPLVFRFDLAKQIKNMNLALDEVYRESERIGLRPIKINTMVTDIGSAQILTDPFVDASKIVGREDDIEKIFKALTFSQDNENVLPVIGIVGMAGQGKTTVAQLIYKHEKVINYFKKRIWVCVSVDFKVERILDDIFQSLTGTKSDLTLREAIVKKIKEEVSGNRFLLVLDDVWNEKQDLWDCLYMCLQEICGSKGSRIIVTTRSEKVITTMGAFSHPLGVLPDEESWMLFEKIAFAKGGAVKTPSLVDIGRKIVGSCGGVPLAIKTLGGLMYSKRNEQEWSEIEENEIWRSSDVAEKVLSAIKLSYDHLPSLSLKQCFAFCSVYEKDYVYEREELVQLWMAHGLLNPSRESQLEMEHIGDSYFSTLLQRSLLQVDEIDEFGNVKYCKMHDLVHDFALQISKGYCLVMDDAYDMNEESYATHLSVHLKEKRTLKMSKRSLLKVQTLVLYQDIFCDVKLSLCKYLRALVVVDFNVKDLPSSIEELKHLRYLDISCTRIERLPNGITKLYHLQTLRASYLPELPKNFADLVNLRHFSFSKGLYYQVFCWFRGIENLTSLQTLPHFAVNQEGGQLEELSNLQNLRGVVKIFGLENVHNYDEAVKAKLENKKNIKSLVLNWGFHSVREIRKDENVLEGLRPHSNLKALGIKGFAGENFPSWMVNLRQPLTLRNLLKIKFEEVENVKQIPPLGHLPCLKTVEISSMRSLKSIDNEFYGWRYLDSASCSQVVEAFPSLEYLEFSDMPNLEEWSEAIHPAGFPIKLFKVLQKLNVSNCPNLRSISNILNQLSSLQLLEVDECNNLSELLPDIGNLRSLTYLDIAGCKKLSSFPGGIEECTSLETLSLTLNSVSWMENLKGLNNLRLLNLVISENIDTDRFPWPFSYIPHSQQCPFLFLEILCLRGTSMMRSLPEEIMHLSVLRELLICCFDGLEALPEWLGNVSSLENLYLEKCKNLAHFPSAQAIQGLSNLKSLIIFKCPFLFEILQRRDGPEWRKVSHVPDIRFY